MGQRFDHFWVSNSDRCWPDSATSVRFGQHRSDLDPNRSTSGPHQPSFAAGAQTLLHAPLLDHFGGIFPASCLQSARRRVIRRAFFAHVIASPAARRGSICCSFCCSPFRGSTEGLGGSGGPRRLPFCDCAYLEVEGATRPWFLIGDGSRVLLQAAQIWRRRWLGGFPRGWSCLLMLRDGADTSDSDGGRRVGDFPQDRFCLFARASGCRDSNFDRPRFLPGPSDTAFDRWPF